MTIKVVSSSRVRRCSLRVKATTATAVVAEAVVEVGTTATVEIVATEVIAEIAEIAEEVAVVAGVVAEESAIVAGGVTTVATK